jgi:hypothetical protein
MESEVFALTCLFIGCFIFGLFLPAKKNKHIDFPFEVVVRERKRENPPKVIVKEVIRYVDRPAVSPRKSTPIKNTKTTSAIPSPKTPAPVFNPPITKKGAPTPLNKTAFAEAKQGLVAMGYKVGEAKRILEAVGHCDSAEEYIRKAMTRTKK